MDKNKAMENYDYLFKKLAFEDTSDDSDYGASKLRKLAALNFYSSLEFEEDNRFTCDLLKNDLEAYAKVVDGDLDNYRTQISETWPKNFVGRQKEWKCSITDDKIADLLANLECNRSGSSKWDKVNCEKSKLSDDDVKILKIGKQEEKRKIPVVQPKQVFSIFQSKKVKKIEEEVPKLKNVVEEVKPVVKKVKKVEEEVIAPPVGAFKTAGEELRQQNAKKFGKESYNYGTVKKSLGARGGGVHGKFTPPVLRNEDEGEKNKPVSQSPETEVDERLKNIDPKMIEIIQNEIMDSGPKLSWDDIAGLEFAKNTIQEVVVWPMLRPDIFTGLRRPPKGILLFGPPGTGKTLIGKCIASQSGATFLSISASSLTSKWVGDGEKMVRALFAVARVNQPSVVFIDEIDSLLSQRSDTEHESSRRIKTEFLVQLDGVGTGDEDRILIIGATNRPQELDEAARRRLVKRLYIPLPETKARADIIRSLISNERHTLTETDINEIAELTEGYSGADMKHVCQEASLGPIRSIPARMICNIDTSQVRAVDVNDFKSALSRVKSTVSPNDLHNYLTWDRQFGCSSI